MTNRPAQLRDVTRNGVTSTPDKLAPTGRIAVPDSRSIPNLPRSIAGTKVKPPRSQPYAG